MLAIFVVTSLRRAVLLARGETPQAVLAFALSILNVTFKRRKFLIAPVKGSAGRVMSGHPSDYASKQKFTKSVSRAAAIGIKTSLMMMMIIIIILFMAPHLVRVRSAYKDKDTPISSNTHTHTHARTHATHTATGTHVHTHARTHATHTRHARTHARTHYYKYMHYG